MEMKNRSLTMLELEGNHSQFFTHGMEELVRENEQLNRNLKEKNLKFSFLESQNKELTCKLEELQFETSRISEKIDELTTENHQLQSKNENLMKKSKSSDVIQHQNNQLYSKIEEYKEELASTQEKLKESEKLTELLNKQIIKMEEEKNQITSELQEEQKNNQEELKRLDHLQIEYQKLLAKLKSKETTLKELEESLIDKDEMYAKLEKAFENEKTKNAEQINLLKAQRDELQIELSQKEIVSNSIGTSLYDELAEFQSNEEQTSLQEKINLLEQEKIELSRRQAEQEKENAQLAQQIDELLRTKPESNQEIAQLLNLQKQQQEILSQFHQQWKLVCEHQQLRSQLLFESMKKTSLNLQKESRELVVATEKKNSETGELIKLVDALRRTSQHVSHSKFQTNIVLQTFFCIIVILLLVCLLPLVLETIESSTTYPRPT